jgi:hypothetical protein
MPPDVPVSLLTPEMLSLHRYWVHANRLREHFNFALANPEWLELAKITGAEAHPLVANFAFMLHDPGIFMSYWYGALYVVVEGWQELKLSDSEVDKLLSSSNVNLLRRFRNSVFHYQKSYMSDKFLDFTGAEDTVPWVHDLTNAMGAYFRRLAGDAWPTIGQDVRQRFKDFKPDKNDMAAMLRTLQSLTGSAHTVEDDASSHKSGFE